MDGTVSRDGTLSLRKRKSDENYQNHPSKRVTETEGFPVNSIPRNLCESIAEKMLFYDFAKFNACSKFSMKVCSMLPKDLNWHMKIGCLDYFGRESVIWPQGSHCECHLLKKQTDFQRTGRIVIKIEELPENVTISCDAFHLNTDSDDIRRIRITTSKLDIRGPYGGDLLLVNELIEITKPKILQLTQVTPFNTQAFLQSKVKEVPQLILPSVAINDDLVKGLNVPFIKCFEYTLDRDRNIHVNNCTARGIFEVIHEWIHEDRTIKRFCVPLSQSEMAVLVHVLEAEAHFTKVYGKNNYRSPVFLEGYLCRSDEHHDCLSLSMGLNYGVDMSCAFKCPKKK